MEIAAVKRQLPVLAAALAQQRSHEPAAGLTDVDPMWPLYGALMTNMSNITEAMVEVAAAQPVTADTSIGVS